MWLSKEERLSVMDRFGREMEEGVEQTNLFYGGEAIPLLLLMHSFSSRWCLRMLTNALTRHRGILTTLTGFLQWRNWRHMTIQLDTLKNLE